MIDPKDEAAFARSFKQSDFFRNVFVPYMEERKANLHEKLDELMLRSADKTTLTILSGRRRELADMEEWLETLFKRPSETKGS